MYSYPKYVLRNGIQGGYSLECTAEFKFQEIVKVLFSGNPNLSCDFWGDLELLKKFSGNLVQSDLITRTTCSSNIVSIHRKNISLNSTKRHRCLRKKKSNNFLKLRHDILLNDFSVWNAYPPSASVKIRKSSKQSTFSPIVSLFVQPDRYSFYTPDRRSRTKGKCTAYRLLMMW